MAGSAKPAPVVAADMIGFSQQAGTDKDRTLA
jgi:hypothetical protein